MDGSELTRSELETRLRILENENEQLAERAEEILLLGLVGEIVQATEEPDVVIQAALERTAILKDLPLCLCGSLMAGGAVRIIEAYLSFTDRELTHDTFVIGHQRSKALEQGALQLTAEDCAALSFAVGDGSTGFTPRSAFLIPFTSRRIPFGVFLFATGDDEDRLLGMALLLHRMVDLVSARLDVLALLDDLVQLNAELDRKVEERTHQLIELNRGLEESEGRFRRLVESSGDAYFVLDREGRILDVNGQASDDLGYDRNQLLGMGLADIEEDFDADELDLLILRARQGQRITVQRRHRRHDGTTFPAELRISVLQVEPELELLAVARDISGRRALEDQLRQAQRLESIGRLAGGIAHDFNNILSTIIGFSELSLMDLPPEHPLTENLRTILEAGGQASRLTRQLLAFSRKQVLSIEVLDLSAVIAHTAKMLGRILAEDVELVLDTDCHCPVRADWSQIEQVVLNLVVNARDAMPDGGRLEVSTAVITLGSDGADDGHRLPPGRYAELRVADTGIGMEEELIGKIFEPFFTTKGVDKGTGLGLATTFGIVKQHGGEISVDSIPGRGTTFRVLFPITDQSPSTLESEAEGGTLARGAESILVVDNAAGIRTIVHRILSSLGYRVRVAENGEQALRVLGEESGIDLMLSDIVMPGLSGDRLAEAVAQRWPEVKTVLMSGFTTDHAALDRIRESGIPFLKKPFGPREVAEAIRHALDQPRSR